MLSRALVLLGKLRTVFEEFMLLLLIADNIHSFHTILIEHLAVLKGVLNKRLRVVLMLDALSSGLRTHFFELEESRRLSELVIVLGQVLLLQNFRLVL